MKRWYNRKPETMQDWLLLFAVAAALLAAVWYLPAIAAALRVLLGLATPFAGGLALAYVLDIPARWFAIHLFGGRRGPGILLAYLALFGTVAALVGLVVPQLVQSVGSFAAALPGYLENAQALLELVQANYGVDTTSLSELLLNSGSSVESFLSGLAPQLAQAAMGAAGQVVNGFLALAASSTRTERARVSSPSWAWGNSWNSLWEMASWRTASPRNSRRSFHGQEGTADSAA